MIIVKKNQYYFFMPEFQICKRHNDVEKPEEIKLAQSTEQLNYIDPNDTGTSAKSNVSDLYLRFTV